MSKYYSQKFRDEAVALMLDSDCPYSKFANDLGVNYRIVDKCIRRAMSNKKASPVKSWNWFEDSFALSKAYKKQP